MAVSRLSKKLILEIVRSRQVDTAQGVASKLRIVMQAYAAQYPQEWSKLKSVFSAEEIVSLFAYAGGQTFEELLAFAFDFPLGD